MGIKDSDKPNPDGEFRGWENDLEEEFYSLPQSRDWHHDLLAEIYSVPKTKEDTENYKWCVRRYWYILLIFFWYYPVLYLFGFDLLKSNRTVIYFSEKAFLFFTKETSLSQNNQTLRRKILAVQKTVKI